MQQIAKGKLNSNSRHVLDPGARSRAGCYMTANTTFFQGNFFFFFWHKLLILAAFPAVFLQRRKVARTVHTSPHPPAMLATTQRSFSCQRNCVSIFDGNF